MIRWVHVVNSSRAGSRLARARWCSTFLCRLRGLSLRGGLHEGEGLLLVESRPSRANAAIHMAGMRFPLGVVWIDGEGRVVDTRLARPWGIYVPSRPAQYTLEAQPSVLEQVAPGDRLVFADV
jgi:uncharacterized membrane protein (UPF0127 family)